MNIRPPTRQMSRAPADRPAKASGFGISVVSLGVGDLLSADRFYREGFGLIHARPPQEVIYFELPGALLALCQRNELARYAGLPRPPSSPGEKPSDDPFGGITLSCNVASRSEVEDRCALAQRAGARIVREPHDERWGGYCAWIADLDHHLWEIVFNPRWSGGQ
ncbi:VOC family protein [Thioalkalivibrio sp. HK1]|uniref:VOC family protein n=1 Tax=Thioalkalivibrio sp. HK1 TaxID=1469245 RepID=UPI000470EE86|nr:VOC family protein [Thioalkalivibrio sp. HK1]